MNIQLRLLYRLIGIGAFCVAGWIMLFTSIANGAQVTSSIASANALVTMMPHTPLTFTSYLPVVINAQPSQSFPNCRFGVGGNVDGYAVTALNIGWHMNWSTQLTPARPGGADYVQVVRLQPTIGGYSFSPTTATLHSIMDQNPGSIWLIGNEPDSLFQDRVTPETYAQAYHDVYALLKQHDPSARIGAGSLVEPTPLRFQYLDRFLAAYQQNFGHNPPVDIWSTHSYILREISAYDPQVCQSNQACTEPPYAWWGAEIPKGITATRGILYKFSDMYKVNIFQQRLIDFRAWMNNRGYRDTPLYITEYGTLFPYPPYNVDSQGPFTYVDENGKDMDEARTANFMTSTFNSLLSLSDPAIGYPADANRLVQRWLWYSVSDPGFGGLLFDPATHARRPLGDVFYSYTHAISPSIDLLAVHVVAEPAAISDTGQLQTATLKATISNIGNISITQPITVAFFSGWPPTGTLIGAPQIITQGLDGCAATTEVSVTWSNLSTGVHPMYIIVDPSNTLPEMNRTNNQTAGAFLVAEHTIFLPLIMKSYP